MQEDLRFYSYSLDGVLERETRLYVDTLYFVVMLVDNNTEPPELLELQILTFAEYRIFRSLLDNFPHYAPHKEIYAAQTGESVKRSEMILDKAKELGTWDSTMRPARNVASRLRLKIQLLGIDIKTILDTGMILLREEKRR